MDPLDWHDWPAELNPVKAMLARPLSVYEAFANHPGLLLAWMPFRDHIVKANRLDPRCHELVILRTAANTQTDYEWHHHVIRGRRAGLSDDEIARVAEGPDAPAWDPMERLLLRVVDQLTDGFAIEPAQWTALNSRLAKEQVLDLLCTVGMYMTLACVINSCGVTLEADLEQAEGK